MRYASPIYLIGQESKIIVPSVNQNAYTTQRGDGLETSCHKHQTEWRLEGGKECANTRTREHEPSKQTFLGNGHQSLSFIDIDSTGRRQNLARRRKAVPERQNTKTRSEFTTQTQRVEFDEEFSPTLFLSSLPTTLYNCTVSMLTTTAIVQLQTKRCDMCSCRLGDAFGYVSKPCLQLDCHTHMFSMF